MKARTNRTTAVQSISIQPKLLSEAKRVAEKSRRSLSAHIQLLIEKDLEAAAKEAAK